jgi:hypothetical protein
VAWISPLHDLHLSPQACALALALRGPPSCQLRGHSVELRGAAGFAERGWGRPDLRGDVLGAAPPSAIFACCQSSPASFSAWSVGGIPPDGRPRPHPDAESVYGCTRLRGKRVGSSQVGGGETPAATPPRLSTSASTYVAPAVPSITPTTPLGADTKGPPRVTSAQHSISECTDIPRSPACGVFAP